MKQSTLLILLATILLIPNNAVNAKGWLINPGDTAVWQPGEEIPYIPIDTINVNEPDTTTTTPPIIIPSEPSIDGRNVVEFPHNPSELTTMQQSLTFTLVGNQLRVNGQILVKGCGKHYLDYQIIGDSVILQRIDMNSSCTDVLLHEIDVLIPGFTENSYRITLDEYTDVSTGKYKAIVSRGQSGGGVNKIAEQQNTAKRVLITKPANSVVRLTFSEDIARSGNAVNLYKVDGSKIDTQILDANRSATFNNLPRGIYLYRLYGESTQSGKIVINR